MPTSTETTFEKLDAGVVQLTNELQLLREAGHSTSDIAVMLLAAAGASTTAGRW